MGDGVGVFVGVAVALEEGVGVTLGGALPRAAAAGDAYGNGRGVEREKRGEPR